jgi:hypothetical protein
MSRTVAPLGVMTTPETGTEDLLGQAQAGDNPALGELLERHRARWPSWPGSRSTVAFRGQTEAEVAGWLRAILAHPASLSNRRGR